MDLAAAGEAQRLPEESYSTCGRRVGGLGGSVVALVVCLLVVGFVVAQALRVGLL